MLRALIVDDEPLARELLQSMLRGRRDVEIVGCCANGREAVRDVQRLLPDLLLLDIQMPGLDGFDVVRKIQADILPMVIFVTAYDEYAVNAFELFAVDYVLKPVNPERLDLALSRAALRASSMHVADRKSTVIQAMQRARAPGATEHPIPEEQPVQLPDRLVIRDGAQTFLVPFGEILWIDAAGDYMCVHVGPQTHVMRCTMKELEQRLPQGMFARIHRSTIVNLARIEVVDALPKGESLLHLPEGVTLKVSRNFRGAIQHLRG